MSGSDVSIMFDVFIAGILASMAYLHYSGGERVKKNRYHYDHADHQPQGVVMPKAIREELLEEAEVKFRNEVDHSVARLDQQLAETIQKVSDYTLNMSNEMFKAQAETYNKLFEGIKTELISEVNKLESDKKSRTEGFEKELEQEIAAQKQKIADKLNSKLADSVTAFLVEALPHNIDMGAQSNYLMSMLEEHKQDLIKEVSDG